MLTAEVCIAHYDNEMYGWKLLVRAGQVHDDYYHVLKAATTFRLTASLLGNFVSGFLTTVT